MSDLAKTEQRPAMVASLAAAVDNRESSPTSILRRRDCCSRNEPVPAAQASLVEKSLTAPSSPKTMNFEVWPPISMMLLAPGCSRPMPSAIAMMAFTAKKAAAPAGIDSCRAGVKAGTGDSKANLLEELVDRLPIVNPLFGIAYKVDIPTGVEEYCLGID